MYKWFNYLLYYWVYS